MKYIESLRNIELDLKKTHIENVYSYNGYNCVRLTNSGLEYVKSLVDPYEGDFRYVIYEKQE